MTERVKLVESFNRNRVSAEEQALAVRLLTELSPCIGGLAISAEARFVYHNHNPKSLKRFNGLVRLGTKASEVESQELSLLWKELLDANLTKKREFDAVLLNSHVAVIGEAKSTINEEQLLMFHNKIDGVIRDASLMEEYGVFRSMSILPVLQVSLLPSGVDLRKMAMQHGILLMLKNGNEYGHQLVGDQNQKRGYNFYKELLRNPCP